MKCVLFSMFVMMAMGSPVLADDTMGDDSARDMDTDAKSMTVPADTDSVVEETADESSGEDTTPSAVDETKESDESKSEAAAPPSEATPPAAASTSVSSDEQNKETKAALSKSERAASASEVAEQVKTGPIRPAKISLTTRKNYEMAVAEYDRQFKRSKTMQSTGYGLLAASFGFEIIGTILIEVAPWGPVGWTGFGIVGFGLAHFLTSAFLLGLSKPPHHLEKPKNPYDTRIAVKDEYPEVLIVM